jgi:hypothetical protein
MKDFKDVFLPILIIALLLSSIPVITGYREGKRKAEAMEVIITDLGLVTDYDCAEVARLFNLPTDGYAGYTFWELVDAGSEPTNPIAIRNFIMKYINYSPLDSIK